MNTFNGKLAILQRVLPSYRAPFFDGLADACDQGLSLFAGEPRPQESIQTISQLNKADFHPANNLHFFSGPFYLCWQRGLVDWLESWQPDALIVEANPRYLSTRLAVSWMRKRDRPILAWGLGAPPLKGLLAPIRQTRRKKFLSQFDGVISYSERGAKEYLALGIAQEKIFVAHNAAAPKPTAAPPQRPPSYHENKPTLLFVGRLQERKRLDLLFTACAQNPLQPRLLIVGDGPAREIFEKQAQTLYPQTEFLGAKFGEELNEIYAAADLFVLPGTGGLAIQHAMAHGLPVIVAQGDGTQDDLVRHENGYLLPSGDQQALTNTLRFALEDPQKLRQMGSCSYQIASDEINLESMVSKFVSALNSSKTKSR